MKPILIIGIVLGVMMITVGGFMYFYKLDQNVLVNARNIEFLRKNDSIFLEIANTFKINDSISKRNDSLRMNVSQENNRLLKQLIKTTHK